MTLIPRWFRLLLSRFTPKKRRAPRRKPCGCGKGLAHAWSDHDKLGCRWCRTAPEPCLLKRNGQPARRALAAVKESA